MLTHTALVPILSYQKGAAVVPQGQFITLQVLVLREWEVLLSEHFLWYTLLFVLDETYTISRLILLSFELNFNSVSAKGIEGYLKQSELRHSAMISVRSWREDP